jgi:hypothetical protein
LFGYKELNKTVYFLVNGWVTMCLDGHFPETMPVTGGRKTYRASVTLDSLQKALEPEGKKKKRAQAVDYSGVQVSRRQYGQHFDMTAAEYSRRIQKPEDYKEIDGPCITWSRTSVSIPSGQDSFAYAQAPAFFGESCIWVNERAGAETTYAAKCLTRTEFATVDKSAFTDLIRDLPYLKRRFEHFRQHFDLEIRASKEVLHTPADSDGDGSKGSMGMNGDGDRAEKMADVGGLPGVFVSPPVPVAGASPPLPPHEHVLEHPPPPNTVPDSLSIVGDSHQVASQQNNANPIKVFSDLAEDHPRGDDGGQ